MVWAKLGLNHTPHMFQESSLIPLNDKMFFPPLGTVLASHQCVLPWVASYYGLATWFRTSFMASLYSWFWCPLQLHASCITGCIQRVHEKNHEDQFIALVRKLRFNSLTTSFTTIAILTWIALYRSQRHIGCTVILGCIDDDCSISSLISDDAAPMLWHTGTL